MKYFWAISALFLASCQLSSNEKEGTSVDKSEFDSMLEIDSLFFEQLAETPNQYNLLKGKDVLFLVSKFDPLKVSAYFYDVIPEYLKLDSLKLVGKYESYLETIDIGQIRNAHSFLVKELSLSSTMTAKLWGISYTSYEACPFYHGTSIFLSIYQGDDLKTTIQVGSKYDISDPPMTFESRIYSFQESMDIKIALNQKELEMTETTEEPEKTMDSYQQDFEYDLNKLEFQ